MVLITVDHVGDVDTAEPSHVVCLCLVGIQSLSAASAEPVVNVAHAGSKSLYC